MEVPAVCCRPHTPCRLLLSFLTQLRLLLGRLGFFFAVAVGQTAAAASSRRSAYSGSEQSEPSVEE
jgi:hypothetical protein